MLSIAGATVQQGRSALAAILLFALVVVVVLTAVTVMLLFLNRRRRREEREQRRSEAVDAWREAGRRALPIDSDPLEREAEE